MVVPELLEENGLLVTGAPRFRSLYSRRASSPPGALQSPITKRRFMVDNFIKSRHWANTLKQAGLPKAF
jgi:hypothetical protein